MDEPRESAREDPEGRRATWLRNGGLRSTGKDEGNGPASESPGQEVSREWHARHRCWRGSQRQCCLRIGDPGGVLAPDSLSPKPLRLVLYGTRRDVGEPGVVTRVMGRPKRAEPDRAAVRVAALRNGRCRPSSR